MTVLNFLLTRLRLEKNLCQSNLDMCFRSVVHLRIQQRETVDFLSYQISRDVRRPTALLKMLNFLFEYQPSNSVQLAAFMEKLPERIAILNIPNVEYISAAIVLNRIDAEHPAVMNAILIRMQNLLRLIQMDDPTLTSFYRSLQYLFRTRNRENSKTIAQISGEFLRRYQSRLGNTKCIFLSALRQIAKHRTLMAEYASLDFILFQKTHLIRVYDVQFITCTLYKYRLYLAFELWGRWVTELESICDSLKMNPQNFSNLCFYIPREVWCDRALRTIINRLSIRFLRHERNTMILPLLGNFFLSHVRFTSLEDGNQEVIRVIVEMLCANMGKLTSCNLYAVTCGVHKLACKESFITTDLVQALVASLSQKVDTFSPGQLTKIVYMLARGGHTIGELLVHVCDYLFEDKLELLHLREINLLLFALLSGYTRDPIKIHAKKFIRYTFRARIDCGEDPIERGNFFRHALTLFTRMGFAISPVVDYAMNILDEILRSVKPAYVLDMLATVALLSASKEAHRKAFDAFLKSYTGLPASRYKLLTAVLSSPLVNAQTDVQFFCKMVSALARCSEEWQKSHHVLTVLRKSNRMSVHLPFEFSLLWVDLCTTAHREIQTNTESAAYLSNRFQIFTAGLKEMASAKCLCDPGPIESVIIAACTNQKIHVSYECLGVLLRALAKTTTDPLNHQVSTFLSEILLSHAGKLSATSLAAGLHCATRIFSIGDVNRREICQTLMDTLCCQFHEASGAALAYSIIADFDAISMKIRSSLLRKLLVNIAGSREILHESPAVKFVRYLSSERVEDADDPLLGEFIESLLVQTLQTLLSLEELTTMGSSRVLHYLQPVRSKYPRVIPYLEAFEKRSQKAEQYC